MKRRDLSRKRWPAAAILSLLLIAAAGAIVLLRLPWWAYVAWALFATPILATSLKVILRGEYYGDEDVPPDREL